MCIARVCVRTRRDTTGRVQRIVARQFLIGYTLHVCVVYTLGMRMYSTLMHMHQAYVYCVHVFPFSVYVWLLVCIYCAYVCVFLYLTVDHPHFSKKR